MFIPKVMCSVDTCFKIRFCLRLERISCFILKVWVLLRFFAIQFYMIQYNSDSSEFWQVARIVFVQAQHLCI